MSDTITVCLTLLNLKEGMSRVQYIFYNCLVYAKEIFYISIRERNRERERERERYKMTVQLKRWEG